MISFTVYSNEVATTPPRMKTMMAQEKENNIVIYPQPEWMRKNNIVIYPHPEWMCKNNVIYPHPEWTYKCNVT
jgi:hypothetical protein